MKGKFKILAAAMLFLLVSTSALAADVTLAWDPTPSKNVAGYKVYYKVGASSSYDGTGIVEGDSPIDVGNNLTAALTGLQENTLYTFTVTSYDVTNLESAFAGSVSWSSADPDPFIPALVYPPNKASDLPTSIVFSWSAPTDGRNVVYSLTFGTDPNLSNASVAYSTPSGRTQAQPINSMPLLAASGLLGLGLRKKDQKRGLLVGLLLVTVLILSGCGGGGSSSGSGITTTTPGEGSVTPAPTEVFASVVDGISQNSFEIYDFDPGTTYYWKVVADDGITVTESNIQSFVTAAN